jgi:hypothetical protein
MKLPFSTRLLQSLCALLLVGCSAPADAPDSYSLALLPTEVSAARGASTRPFKMSRGDLSLRWAVVVPQEVSCGGSRVAGGAITGRGNFTHLGVSTIRMSAAWDIARLVTPQYTPVGPAGGPVAAVLTQSDYPYQFHFDPFTQQCGTTVQATGELVLTAANGDRVFGRVAGGETHRLDFVAPGDGIETFAKISIAGGTGRFAGATGSFVVHTVARFDYGLGRFVIDLAEVLPGGVISY